VTPRAGNAVYNRHRAPMSRLVRARRGNLFPAKHRDGKIDAAAFLLNPLMG
jgi:hypothetical protein